MLRLVPGSSNLPQIRLGYIIITSIVMAKESGLDPRVDIMHKNRQMGQPQQRS